MSTTVSELKAKGVPFVNNEPSKVTYLDHENTVASWLLTLDHKRIGVMYLISMTFMFLLGGIFAGIIRAELITPKGDMLSSDFYNKTFTT